MIYDLNYILALVKYSIIELSNFMHFLMYSIYIAVPLLLNKWIEFTDDERAFIW